MEDLYVEFEMVCYKLFEGSYGYRWVDFEIFFIMYFLYKFKF